MGSMASKKDGRTVTKDLQRKVLNRQGGEECMKRKEKTSDRSCRVGRRSEEPGKELQ